MSVFFWIISCVQQSIRSHGLFFSILSAASKLAPRSPVRAVFSGLPAVIRFGRANNKSLCSLRSHGLFLLLSQPPGKPEASISKEKSLILSNQGFVVAGTGFGCDIPTIDYQTFSFLKTWFFESFIVFLSQILSQVIFYFPCLFWHRGRIPLIKCAKLCNLG